MVDAAACAFGDPTCPCQDGDACHYVDLPDSPAMAPPNDVQRPTPPLTDEELAHIELGASIGVLAKPEIQRRLIADLRASRERVKELKAELAWVDERIDSGEL